MPRNSDPPTPARRREREGWRAALPALGIIRLPFSAGTDKSRERPADFGTGCERSHSWSRCTPRCRCSGPALPPRNCRTLLRAHAGAVRYLLPNCDTVDRLAHSDLLPAPSRSSQSWPSPPRAPRPSSPTYGGHGSGLGFKPGHLDDHAPFSMAAVDPLDARLALECSPNRMIIREPFQPFFQLPDRLGHVGARRYRIPDRNWRRHSVPAGRTT